MHVPSSINTDSSGIATLLSKAGLIASLFPPHAAQSDILAILQREQDHAVSLLSLSPLLSSLFVSYANRAAALESASTTPSLESEEWKVLQSDIAALREENEKLRFENHELVVKLVAAEASQKASRSEAKDTYDQLIMGSNAEKTVHQVQISDHERAELKEAVVEQQTKISKLERQASSSFSNLPKAAATIEPVDVRELGGKLDNREGPNREAVPARSAKAKRRVDRGARERRERRAREQIKRKAKEKAKEVARVEAEGDAKRKAKKEVKERVERGEKERLEREEAERIEKGEREKIPAPKIQSAWGSDIGKKSFMCFALMCPLSVVFLCQVWIFLGSG
ncbi:hypothetical protein BDM02DRAFT_3119982 [Thelephora ganbajun]|uniref:Uncharacterized protein n=1 Tax=Thelephora ganbajun TaxID=370292 RepID=A0ACB6Z7B1_THEGA|nr:hypothetical protein BDM02DRAFT_3119982 [Thelephora ganbajun]